MTHPSKAKGNAYERELVQAAQAAGLEAKRAWGSNGQALGHHDEVDLVVAGKRIQAKRRKSIPAWLSLTANVDAVAVREDRGETVVLVPLLEYLRLLGGRTDA